jgi:hypothetical protein
MRGLTKIIRFGDCEVTVREPSMLEVRNWLESAIEPVKDSLLRLAFQDADEAYLAALPLLVGKTAAELQSECDIRFSEMRYLLSVCREINADFFLTLDRLVEFGRAQTPPANSSAASAP